MKMCEYMSEDGEKGACMTALQQSRWVLPNKVLEKESATSGHPDSPTCQEKTEIIENHVHGIKNGLL